MIGCDLGLLEIREKLFDTQARGLRYVVMEPHVEPGVCCGGGDEAHSCEPNPTAGAVRPGPLDGCPTPLAWQQVLAAFREQATPFEVQRPEYILKGRVWGEGPPLYLLCGMGGTTESFCLLTFLLRDLFRCVVFDYPGTNQPVRSVNRITRESLRDDFIAIADQLGDDQFSLFATSFGSLIALEAMLAHGNRIQRAVLQGAFAHRRLSFAERAIVRLGSLLPGPLSRLPGTKTVQEQNHRRWFPPLDATRWQFFLDDAGRLPMHSVARRGAIIRDTDLRPELPRIQHPILLIQTEGDGLVSRDCHETLKNGLSNSESAWMHSAGHVPHLTNPHRLAKYLRDYLLKGETPQ